MKQTKTCFFNSNKAWGGGEKWHFETARFFKNQEKEVVVFGYKNKELSNRASNIGIETEQVSISSLSFLNPFKVFGLVSKFKKLKVDTIILNLSSDVKCAGIAAKIAGVKNIYYRRGLAVPVKNSFLNRYLLKNVLTKIICNSFDIQNNILVHHPYLKGSDKMVIINNGIKPENYPVYQKKEKQSGDRIIIGNVGRLVEQKAQHYLITLAKELKAQSHNFEIQIVGSGDLDGHLKNLTLENNVNDCVKFLGFKEDLESFYKEIDFFILTSLHEGTSNAFIEAMAWGNPMIAFNVSSMPEMMVDNKNGFLIELGNVDALVEKTENLIVDKNLRTIMGHESLNIVNERYDIYKNLNVLIKMIYGD